MSDARKCDRCGALFKPEKHRTITLDVHIDLDADGGRCTWSDVDMCRKCTELVIKLIKPALNDFPKARR